MTQFVPIDGALKLLTLMRYQRLDPETRQRINKAIKDLTRAQFDPEYRAYLHTPLESRRKQ